MNAIADIAAMDRKLCCDPESLVGRVRGVCKPLHNGRWNLQAGYVAVDVFGHFCRFEYKHPGDDLHPQRLDSCTKGGQSLRVKDRLGLKKTGSGHGFFRKLGARNDKRFPLGRGSGAGKKCRFPVQRLAIDISTLIQTLDRLNQHHRIKVKYGPSLAVVAAADMITGQRKNIMNPHGGSPQQVALQGKAVTVAAGELHDWFNAFTHQQGCRGQR